MIVLRVYETFHPRRLTKVTHAGITHEVGEDRAALWGMDGEDRDLVLDRAREKLAEALGEAA